jgi:ubiquinone/menaquinone biosynthesis C-methylase UbiE
MLADYSGSQKAAIEKFGIDKAGAAIDVGCGIGEKTHYIAERVNFAVGVDPNEELIQAANKRYKSGNLLFQVAKAESLCFGGLSFSSVLFNESLHHVPTTKQKKALEESYRVLKPGGKLLIIEPIYGSGSFGQILDLYNDEEEHKRYAIDAIQTMMGARFNLAIKQKIDIEYHFDGIDDLHAYHVITVPGEQWSNAYKMDMRVRLNQCRKNFDGGFIVDYSAYVWLLIKK